MQDTLVDTKQMPASNLYSYPDIEHAVKDLKNKRIDLVLLDNQPAQTYVQQGGVKLVGEGIEPQLYAMAIPKGADSFRRVLDKALTGVVDSGAYAELAAKYLGLDKGEVQPVPTPRPRLCPPSRRRPRRRTSRHRRLRPRPVSTACPMSPISPTTTPT